MGVAVRGPSNTGQPCEPAAAGNHALYCTPQHMQLLAHQNAEWCFARHQQCLVTSASQNHSPYSSYSGETSYCTVPQQHTRACMLQLTASSEVAGCVWVELLPPAWCIHTVWCCPLLRLLELWQGLACCHCLLSAQASQVDLQHTVKAQLHEAGGTAARRAAAGEAAQHTAASRHVHVGCKGLLVAGGVACNWLTWCSRAYTAS